MNLRTLKKLALATVFVTSAFANADDIRLGIPGYGGNGCPGGSVDAVLSPDFKTLSILFDSFVAEAGRSSGKSIDRKSCNLAIPVHVPQGLSVSLIALDYRGYVSAPRSTTAQFNVEYFFGGSSGPRISNTFVTPHDDEYTITDNLIATALVWSPCGADVNLRVNASMLARTNSRRDDVLATVDSADVTAGIVYKLQWRSCH